VKIFLGMVKFKESDIKIFIVDDDELLVKILRTKFQQNTNYKVYSFSSGDDFISFYKNMPRSNKQIHILILDYLLKPNEPIKISKNGIDYLKEVKSINPQIQVILISAVDDPDIAVDAHNNGATSFIKKNENAFLRINNQIGYIVSEIQLQRAHNRSKRVRQIFYSLLIVFILFVFYIFVSEMLHT
jgi:DNA-binding NtrC family response regulator